MRGLIAGNIAADIPPSSWGSKGGNLRFCMLVQTVKLGFPVALRRRPPSYKLGRPTPGTFSIKGRSRTLVQGPRGYSQAKSRGLCPARNFPNPKGVG